MTGRKTGIAAAAAILTAGMLMTGIVTPAQATPKDKYASSKTYSVPYESVVFYSHRGLANVYPENTVIALDESMKTGFDGINWDIWPTKPNKQGKFDFAVTHDNTLISMTDNKGLVSKTSASKIKKLKVTKGNNAKKSKQKMVLFSEALKITKKYQCVSQIEMKGMWTQKQTNLLAKKIKDSKIADLIEVESLEAKDLIRFKKSMKKYRISVPTNYVSGQKSNALKRAKTCKKHKFTNLAIRYNRVTKKAVAYCRKNKIGVGAYIPVGMNSNKLAHKLLKYDLDYIVAPGIAWSPEATAQTLETKTAEKKTQKSWERVYSHRGASGERPEHTFAAYDLAIKQGSHFIELDVRLSKNGTLWVLHDKSVKRMTGVKKNIANMTDKQIRKLKVSNGEHLHTLQQVFDRYGKKITYVVELKEGQKNVKPFIEIVKNNKLEKHIIVQAWKVKPLTILEKTFPDMKKYLLVSKSKKLVTTGSKAEAVDGVNVYFSLVSKKMVKQVHKAGKTIGAWTLNTVGDVKKAKRLNLDYYLTNYPGRSLAAEKRLAKY